MVSAGESDHTKKHLLLIACSENFCRTLSRILCRSGYNVDVSGSGEEALARIESNSYDAIISEIFLPGNVCGLTLLQRVRKQFASLPVIFLTEGETERVRSAIADSRNVTCLSMPVDVDELKHTIAASTTAGRSPL